MTLPIIENPLYGLIQLETAAWGATFTWVDRTADLAGGFNYSEGGRVGPPGQSNVDVGTLNATFKEAATIPAIGSLVRLRRYGTSEYFFTGYVQDVSQSIVFDNSISLNTPVTLTTIHCADWVGYIGQFQAVGAGGVQSNGTVLTTSYYAWPSRIEALNKTIDATMATDLITYTGTGSALVQIGDTDLVGSLAQHLDLVATTVLPTYWYGTHVLPTDITTGRDSLIEITENTPTASGYTFRDDLGSGSNQLHYIEIDFENSTQNVANTIVLNNRTRLNSTDVEVTRVGGYNESNYMVIGNTNVIGTPVDTIQKSSDSTSITTYGVRQAEFETNAGVSSSLVYNLAANPSLEYNDDGWISTQTWGKVRRRKPSQEPTPFTAAVGEWALRTKVANNAGGNLQSQYQGGEADGTPVIPGTTYYFKASAARGSTSATDAQASLKIIWIDEEEIEISNTTGASVSLTTANTWYAVSHSAVAPAGAYRANLNVTTRRSGGGNFVRGGVYWADALYFSKSNLTYFDGDYPATVDYVYGWTGGVGGSQSFRAPNNIDNIADALLLKYSTTSMRAARIRWNAQENLAAVSSLTVGKSISLVYDGTTTTYRIIGIDGTVEPDRYMIDYYLVKV